MNATIWKVFEIAVNIYEGFNIFYFVFSFFEYNFKPKENRLVFSIGVLGYTIVVLDCQPKIVQKLFSQRESLKLNRS